MSTNQEVVLSQSRSKELLSKPPTVALDLLSQQQLKAVAAASLKSNSADEMLRPSETIGTIVAPASVQTKQYSETSHALSYIDDHKEEGKGHFSQPLKANDHSDQIRLDIREVGSDDGISQTGPLDSTASFPLSSIVSSSASTSASSVSSATSSSAFSASSDDDIPNLL